MSRATRALPCLATAAALGLVLTGCGGSSGNAAATSATASASSTSDTSSTSATSATSAGSSTTDTSTSSPTSSAASSAPSSAAAAGGAGGSAAHAILPTPGPSIGSKAEKGSAMRAKVKGSDLGLLGKVPNGKAYAVGKVGSRGVVDSGSWPDACALLSDGDIKTLLPKTGRISRQGQHGSFLGGGETKHFSTCKYKVPQPGDSDVVPSYFDIDLNAVGDPGAVTSQFKQTYDQAKQSGAKYPDQFYDYSGGELGGATCFYDGNAIQCAKGHFDFTVLGGSGRNSGAGNAAYAQEHGYVEQVEANVVKTLALRMH